MITNNENKTQYFKQIVENIQSAANDFWFNERKNDFVTSIAEQNQAHCLIKNLRNPVNEIGSIPVSEHYGTKNIGQTVTETETIKDTIVENFVYSLNTVSEQNIYSQQISNIVSQGVGQMKARLSAEATAKIHNTAINIMEQQNIDNIRAIKGTRSITYNDILSSIQNICIDQIESLYKQSFELITHIFFSWGHETIESLVNLCISYPKQSFTILVGMLLTSFSKFISMAYIANLRLPFELDSQLNIGEFTGKKLFWKPLKTTLAVYTYLKDLNITQLIAQENLNKISNAYIDLKNKLSVKFNDSTQNINQHMEKFNKNIHEIDLNKAFMWTKAFMFTNIKPIAGIVGTLFSLIVSWHYKIEVKELIKSLFAENKQTITSEIVKQIPNQDQKEFSTLIKDGLKILGNRIDEVLVILIDFLKRKF